MSAGPHHRVAARGKHVHHAFMDADKDDLPQSWLNESSASPDHVRTAWQESKHLGEHPAYAELLGTPTLRERIVALWHGLGETMHMPMVSGPRFALAGLAAVVLLAGVWTLQSLGRPDYATQIAEVRDIRLEDGSVVTLGAQSALDVDFTAGERAVRLTRGEAFFAVSHDTARPFVVLAGDKRIRVVGTRFNVNFDGSRMRVAVQQGIVDVAHASMSSDGAGSAQRVRLVAGQQLVAPEAGPLSKPASLRGSEPGAWRSGRLDYQDAPLSEIISDASRYYGHPILIASPALAGERLTTSFRASQVDQMLETLPSTLPVLVKRDGNGTVTLQQDPAAAQ